MMDSIKRRKIEKIETIIVNKLIENEFENEMEENEKDFSSSKFT